MPTEKYTKIIGTLENRLKKRTKAKGAIKHEKAVPASQKQQEKRKKGGSGASLLTDC